MLYKKVTLGEFALIGSQLKAISLQDCSVLTSQWFVNKIAQGERANSCKLVNCNLYSLPHLCVLDAVFLMSGDF